MCWSLPGLLVLLLAGLAAAQSTTTTPQAPGAATVTGFYTDSWAVIVGINEYQHRRVPKLRYAVNDAKAIEVALLAQGFRRDRITTLLDGQATRTAIEEVLGDQLRLKVGNDDRVLVFFAGHGKTDTLRSGDEEGYLMPVDSDPSKLFSTAISMETLRRLSARIPAKHILYVVDACYSGYAMYNRAISDDLLEEMIKKPAIQILTAGRQQDQAQERGGHGVFTQVLLRGLQGDAFTPKGWLALEELGLWMKERVYAESGKQQLPQFGNLSGEGQFVFLRPGGQVAAVQPRPEPPRPTIREQARKEFGSLTRSARIDGLEVFLGGQPIGETKPGRALIADNLPVGVYRVTARKVGHKDWAREVQVAVNQRTELSIDIEPLRSELPTAIKGDDGAEMVLVPAGEFWMGSTEADVAGLIKYCAATPNDVACASNYSSRELPKRRVRLDRFYIDRYEVTNALFERFIKATSHRTRAEIEGDSNVLVKRGGSWQWVKISDANWRAPTGPGSGIQPDHPVVQVSWYDADAYCHWAGKRLPTEAEWEKAARGEDGREYPWGPGWHPAMANAALTVATTTPVGRYPRGASPYGVQDMAGNVWEWVADWYDAEYYKTAPAENPRGPDIGTLRVIRGGAFPSNPSHARAASRGAGNAPHNSAHNTGFRCAKDTPK